MRFLGRFAAKYSKSVLLGFIGLIALSTIWGFQAFGALKGGGYDDPNSDSTRAFELLDEVYNQRLSEVIVLADFSLPARSAESAALGAQLQQELEAVEGVVAVTSFYTLGQPDSLVSDDGKAVYFFVDLDDAAGAVGHRDDGMLVQGLQQGGVVALGLVQLEGQPFVVAVDPAHRGLQVLQPLAQQAELALEGDHLGVGLDQHRLTGGVPLGQGAFQPTHIAVQLVQPLLQPARVLLGSSAFSITAQAFLPPTPVVGRCSDSSVPSPFCKP
mgnify:CR=1 FL=1